MYIDDINTKPHLTYEASNARRTVQRHLASADELVHQPPGEQPKNKG